MKIKFSLEQPQKIIIDTDVGLDDAAAMILALNSEQLTEILGITTIAGVSNAIDQTIINAYRILRLTNNEKV